MPHFPKAADFGWFPAKFATLLFPQARSSTLRQSNSRVDTIHADHVAVEHHARLKAIFRKVAQ
jgi:hypothetical protein